MAPAIHVTDSENTQWQKDSYAVRYYNRQKIHTEYSLSVIACGICAVLLHDSDHNRTVRLQLFKDDFSVLFRGGLTITEFQHTVTLIWVYYSKKETGQQVFQEQESTGKHMGVYARHSCDLMSCPSKKNQHRLILSGLAYIIKMSLNFLIE